jgi:hypothetical protein
VNIPDDWRSWRRRKKRIFMGNNHCNADSIAVKWAQSIFISRNMEPEYSLAGALPPAAAVRRICLALVALACLLPPRVHAQTLGPNIFPQGSFENVVPTYVPWAGVDGNNNIHGIDGRQIAVGDDGNIQPYSFGPSAVTADMNGDGLPDLVLGDARGFFWLFINHGTPQQPKFTQGEVMPIWLGEERINLDSEGYDNVVPRIQVLDFDGLKKLDVLAGMYSGKLFRIHNVGSPTLPDFKPTKTRDLLLINTHKHGLLWSNYMAPVMTTAFSTSPTQPLLDLIVGEGTYSANSIYLLRNINSNSNPSYSEDKMQKIIPGMGLEQLTPAVVDWNNDGKPDIITGDRTGYLTLFLNTSKDPDNITFDTGTRIKIGGVDKFGTATTVSIGDLSGNHLPNLLIGTADGTILYALNTGKLGAPDFSTPAAPLKGELPPDYHHIASGDWHQDQAYGAPYELVSCVNPEIEKGFKFPEGQKTKYALKFWVFPYTNVFFKERYYPVAEDELREHDIICPAGYTIKLNVHYKIHFWVKSLGNVSNFRYRVRAANIDRDGFHGYDVENPINAGTSWSEVNDEFEIRNPDDKTVTTWPYSLEIRSNGQTTFYLDDVQIQEVLQ